MDDIRIIVGAGTVTQEGFVSLQESDLDITNPEQWARLFSPSSISAIVAEHVFEHLSFSEGLQAARLCYLYLKRGGTLRVAVPDGCYPNDRYIWWVSPGTGWNGDDHKVLFDYRSLGDLMHQAGFCLDYKEFWDERGEFYTEPIEWERGELRRVSSSRDLGAIAAGLVIGADYTSLVIDGIKL